MSPETTPDLSGPRPDGPPEITADAPINILIVDDEPGNLLVLETVLDDPGYRLVRAHSPDQALLALVEQEFALLILDIRMPGMTGFELAQMIKGRRKTANVPIIFLTAYYDKDQHVLEGYGTGAVDFLNKPVNPAVLRSKVSVFAELHRMNRAITLANRSLTEEVRERRHAEAQLRELNETLERRVAERTEALRRADRKLQAMMSSITDALFMLDREGRFTFANEEAARLLGTRADRLPGVSIWERFADTLGPQFEQACRQAARSGQTVSFEAFHPPPLGIWLRCHCYPSDEGLSVYLHDVTDRREVEVRREQLLSAEQAARSESERMARAKDEFLASLSHELRTPLAAIVGWAKLLKRTKLDAETLSRGIDAIERNALAQSRLVGDLLDMSRIVSGKLRMELLQVDLNTIATAAADSARPAAQAKGLTLNLQLAAGVSLDIVGDPTRLEQIVSNLVANALKFTPAGGVVTISTARHVEQAALTVSDTGQGVEARFLPHLFDRFSQADGSAARVHGGLGLGLSIVKHLVELLGGIVTASSAGRDHGAAFEVRFPSFGSAAAPIMPADDSAVQSAHADESSRPWAEEPAPGGVGGLSGIKVLLVDDHADMLELERRLLTEYGAVVETAPSADQALKHLRSASFDVLLSDLGMPGQDGYALIDSVRSILGLGPDALPAAAVTAFVRAEDRQRALNAGFQMCIQKPVSPAALLRAVLELTRSKAGTALPRLRTLFIEDNLELQEQIGWQLEEEGLDLVTCATAEEAVAKIEKGQGFDLVVTDVSLPQMSGVELARWVLARSPSAWVVFSTGYPMGDKLSEFGPHVRALLKPFEAEELQSLVREVRASPARTG